MGLSESIRSSAAEILAHKLRSILTLAGIVLGTTALVVMVSVIGGAAKAVDELMEGRPRGAGGGGWHRR